MTPVQRFAAIRSKGLCIQCLFPGAKVNEGKHKDGSCQHDFVCKHQSHAKYHRKKHVLICEEHKGEQENINLLETYKKRFILKDGYQFPDYSKQIKLSLVTYAVADPQTSTENASVHIVDVETSEKAIYQLQKIKIRNQHYSIFYDSGCGEFVSTIGAVKRLGSRAD